MLVVFLDMIHSVQLLCNMHCIFFGIFYLLVLVVSLICFCTDSVSLVLVNWCKVPLLCSGEECSVDLLSRRNI